VRAAAGHKLVSNAEKNNLQTYNERQEQQETEKYCGLATKYLNVALLKTEL